MSLKRRQILVFLGAAAGAAALEPIVSAEINLTTGASTAAQASLPPLKFQPLQGVMPYEGSGVISAQQAQVYSNYSVKDDVVLPEGYTYDIVATWGDKVGDSRFGYNNDFLAFIPTTAEAGYLVVNFEYISSLPWSQTFEQVIGKSLPFDAIKAALATSGEDGVNAYELPEGDATKAQIRLVCEEALTDLGIGVISIRRTDQGTWERTYSNRDRRITGISGLKDNHALAATGPATSIFRKTSGIGYIDGLGDRIIGTFNNCAGGTTPWGTMLSAEENFQSYVPEGVYADGTSMHPSKKTFNIDAEEISGLGNPLGLAGNKYGWMVEVDPANPQDYGTKHTWLGRFRHEAVAVRAEAGKRLAVYSGCDRRGGHVYKFVSKGSVSVPTAKINSRLMRDGMLYAAKFNPDGTGRWIALKEDTPINPDLPSTHVGGMITLPNRPDGGAKKFTNDADVLAYKQKYIILTDLYEGNTEERQGAILIDAHYAANAAGATCTARPEDTDLGPDGSLFMTFTSGSPSSSDGGPNQAIFKAPDGTEGAYEYGWIMRLQEEGNDPAAMTFRWSIFATGGEPAEGGLGFANPDNLVFDARGGLWMVTDMSSDKHNKEIANRVGEDGTPVSQSNLRGLFGNNSLWYMPTSGANAGSAYLFAYGPMDAEMTGPCFTPDQKTLFIAAQHPGEVNGVRQDMAKANRRFAMKTTTGQDFMQAREVPLGSNWPGKQPNDPPKPSVISIRRLDNSSLI